MTVAAPAATPPERAYSSESVADLLHRLDDLPANRVRADPPAGGATIADLVAVNQQSSDRACELVSGTLVEKPVGNRESWVGFIIAGRLDRYLEAHDLGMATLEQGLYEILPDTARGPDLAFVAWDSLPNRQPPAADDPVPAVVPDFVVEVLSASNTRREMARKRAEYFRAGVKLVWEIDPPTRSAVAYTADDAGTPVPADGCLFGDPVLPGFVLDLRAVFDRAERRGPAA